MKASSFFVPRCHSGRWVAIGLVAMLCLATWGNAQTISGWSPTTTTAGQNITMILTGANTNFTAVTGLYLQHTTTGTIYYSTNHAAASSTNMTADFSISPNAPLGNYRLHSYSNFAFVNNALNVGVGPGSNYGYVSGKTIVDNNLNCVEDVGDTPMTNQIVELSPGPIYLTTGPQGDFGGWVPLGTYTISSALPNCGAWLCPGTGSQSVSLPTPLSTDSGNDFYWHSTPCSDLQVMVSATPLRPGMTSFAYVLFRNLGADPVTNATGTFLFTGPVTNIGTSVPPTTTSGNSLTWNIPSLAAGASFGVTITLQVPVGTPLGSGVTLGGVLPAVGNDPYLPNNSVSCPFVVTGSFDPNDKQVWDANGVRSDGPTDPSTPSLSYLIRFQNTGTDTAFNIFVRDTLDLEVNPGSLRVTGSSHPYLLSLTGQRNVQFTFPNIMLVDSFHNEPLSHGYISYEVDLLPGLPLGTTISNDASIYFDFNVPVLTNTVNSTLCTTVDPDFGYTGNLLNYSFTDSSASSVTAWLWDFGDGGTSTLQNPSHTYAALGTYVVCLTVSNACRTETICDTVAVCAPAVAGFQSTASFLSVSFSDQSLGSPISWAWDFGDGATSTLQNPTHVYSAAGTYIVCLTATNACMSHTTCDTVVVCTAPASSFATNVSGTAVTFTDQSTGTPTAWLWTFGDGGTSILQNPSHTYAASGNYQVCLQVSNACSSSISCNNLLLVGNEDPSSISLQLRPNPSDGRFEVTGILPSSEACLLQVYDVRGVLVAQLQPDTPNGVLRSVIDLEAHPSGLYFLRVTHEGRSYALKMMKR